MHEGEARFLRRKRLNRALAEGVRRPSAALQCGLRTPRQAGIGAVNKRGGIAVVERFHRTLKEFLHRITIPEGQSRFEREVGLTIDWYNQHRPHNTLDGKTPNEVYFHPSSG